MKPYEPLFLFPLLTTKCPHCYEVTRFGLTEQVAYVIKIFWIGIGRLEEYLIMCGSCGYKEFVRKNDYPIWVKLGDHFKELQKGTITEDDFTAYVAELQLPELKDILVSAATWNCSCGEDNPTNFSVCWKCGSASPVETIETKGKEIYLGDTHPWEK